MEGRLSEAQCSRPPVNEREGDFATRMGSRVVVSGYLQISQWGRIWCLTRTLEFRATLMLKRQEPRTMAVWIPTVCPNLWRSPPLAAFRRSGALRNVLSLARWGEANPCFSPTLPPQGESRTRINDRSRLLVCGFHWDAGATNLITKLHGRILTRSLWRVDSIERVVPDHRFRHCSTSTRSLSVARTTPADDGASRWQGSG
jgi:hypothetical protein